MESNVAPVFAFVSSTSTTGKERLEVVVASETCRFEMMLGGPPSELVGPSRGLRGGAGGGLGSAVATRSSRTESESVLRLSSMEGTSSPVGVAIGERKKLKLSVDFWRAMPRRLRIIEPERVSFCSFADESWSSGVCESNLAFGSSGSRYADDWEVVEEDAWAGVPFGDVPMDDEPDAKRAAGIGCLDDLLELSGVGVSKKLEGVKWRWVGVSK